MIADGRPRFSQMRYTDLGDTPDTGGGMGRRGNFNFPMLRPTGGQGQQFNTPPGAVRGMPSGMQTGGVMPPVRQLNPMMGGQLPPQQFNSLPFMGGNSQQNPWAQSIGWPRGAFGNFGRFGYR